MIKLMALWHGVVASPVPEQCLPACILPAGSLAIPLALRGAAVSASDISSSMAQEAERRYQAAVSSGSKAPKVAPKFEALDLE